MWRTVAGGTHYSATVGTKGFDGDPEQAWGFKLQNWQPGGCKRKLPTSPGNQAWDCLQEWGGTKKQCWAGCCVFAGQSCRHRTCRFFLGRFLSHMNSRHPVSPIHGIGYLWDMMYKSSISHWAWFWVTNGRVLTETLIEESRMYGVRQIGHCGSLIGV